MKSSTAAVCVALALLLGVGIGWLSCRIWGDDRTIAKNWGGGVYGPNFYGAHVYVVPTWTDWSVQAVVICGPGNDQYHMCGELGRAATLNEAVERWGLIRWTPQGVTIGNGSADDFHVPQRRIESHR